MSHLDSLQCPELCCIILDWSWGFRLVNVCSNLYTLHKHIDKHEYAENIYLVNVIYQPLHIKEKVMKGISDHVMFSCLS